MPPERFERLVPLFPYLDAVVLTGFGEPCVNPHLHEFVAKISGAGARPCMTTNGTLLDERRAKALLDAGVQHVQFSIDAGTPQTYERVRVGGKWDRVLRNAETFHKLARGGGYDVETGWVFILLQDTWRELPAAVARARDLGFDLFTAKLLERNVLDFERCQEIHDEEGRLLVSPEEFQRVVSEAQSLAKKSGVRFVIHDFFMGEDGACLADPLHGAFVDWMGYVTPCCHLPVRSESGVHPLHAFGNVDEEDILDILGGRIATDFWKTWRSKRIPWVCRKCQQVRRLPDRNSYELLAEIPRHDTCHLFKSL